MVWWNAVSNTATIGTSSPITARQALMPVMLAGLCSGANGVHSSSAVMTASSILTEQANFSPPWTTRWPTASISFMEVTTPYSALVSLSMTAAMASEWVGIGRSSSKTGLPPMSGVCFR